MYARKIKDVITIGNGFFAHIPFTFPEDITKQALDFQFYTRFSQKNTAPVVNLLLDDDVSQLTSQQLDLIGAAIWQTYNRKWAKQLAVYSIQYNPIYNYKDEYHETNEKIKSGEYSGVWTEDGEAVLEKLSTRTRNDSMDATVTRTDNLQELETRNLTDLETRGTTKTETRNLTDLETRNTTTTETPNLSETVTASASNDVYGFNSDDGVGNTEDDSNSSKSNTGTITTQNTGTVNNGKTGTVTTQDTGTISNGKTGTLTTANSGTQSTVTDSDSSSSDALTGTDTTTTSKSGIKTNADDSTEEGTRDYEHIGNIGNHTSQRLINEEIELWRWNFVEEILEDVKEFTTIPVYLC